MNVRTRTLLAIAMSTALVAPMAFAEKVKTDAKATSDVAAQRAVDTKTDVAEQKTTTRPADAVDARGVPATKLPVQTGKSTEDTTAADQSIPQTAQGAAHAAGHSSVVQRDVWARLDADADGRISTTEADADATFDGDFAAMDSDTDGFVSDAEYRSFAKVDTSQGAENAASHSSVVQRDTWSRLDTDGDGRISAVEADADAGIDGRFAAMDSNSDGFITGAEFRAHAQATRTP